MCSARSTQRSGASLLEVLIATLVLLVSVAALGNQMFVGVRASERARLQTKADVICQSVLAEMIAARSFSSSPARKHPDFDGWMVQVQVNPLQEKNAIVGSLPRDELVVVTVTAWEPGRNELLSKVTLTRITRKFLPKNLITSAME